MYYRPINLQDHQLSAQLQARWQTHPCLKVLACICVCVCDAHTLTLWIIEWRDILDKSHSSLSAKKIKLYHPRVKQCQLNQFHLDGSEVEDKYTSMISGEIWGLADVIWGAAKGQAHLQAIWPIREVPCFPDSHCGWSTSPQDTEVLHARSDPSDGEALAPLANRWSLISAIEVLLRST